MKIYDWNSKNKKIEEIFTHKLNQPLVGHRNSSNIEVMRHLELMVDNTAICAGRDLQSNYLLHPVHFQVMTAWPLHIAQLLHSVYGLTLMHHFPIASIDSQPN